MLTAAIPFPDIGTELLMQRTQRFNMPVSAIAGVTDKNRHRPFGFGQIRRLRQRRIHPRREIQQRRRHAGMALMEVEF